MIPEDASETSRGLAPSATPCVVYGILGVLLAGMPIVGFVFGWMAYLRSRQSMIQLDHDARLEGNALRQWGACFGVLAMILGIASTLIWLAIFIASVM